MHQQYVYAFLIDLQLLFWLLSQNLARLSSVSIFYKLDYHQFLSFISYHLVTVLHLESFENKVFESYFSISKKNVFPIIKPPQKAEFFARLCNMFYRDSCSFPYTITLLNCIRLCFRKRKTTLVNNIKHA